jgi:hypothetical protein
VNGPERIEAAVGAAVVLALVVVAVVPGLLQLRRDGMLESSEPIEGELLEVRGVPSPWAYAIWAFLGSFWGAGAAVWLFG